MTKAEIKKSALRTVYPPIIYGLKKFSISNYDISKMALFAVIQDDKTETFDVISIYEMQDEIDSHEGFISWSAKTLESAMQYCMFASGHTLDIPATEKRVFSSIVSEHLAFVKEVNTVDNHNSLLRISNRLLEDGKQIAKGGALLWLDENTLLRYVWVLDFQRIYQINPVTSK